MNRNRKSRSRLTIILSLIMVLSLMMMPMTSLGLEAGTETEVKFTGTTYDAEANISKWNYQVVSGEQPSLSHWSLAVCEEHKITAVSDNWIETTEALDGSTGFMGLKFEQSLEANETINVWIELEGNWETGLVDAITKSGNDFVELEVEGPTCVAAAENTVDEDSITGEAAIELDAAAVITTIPEDAVLLSETTKFKVYLSTDNELLIHANAETDTEISGNWTINLGGQLYTVAEGTNQIVVKIDNPSVGTQELSAVFASPEANVETELEVINVTVPLVTDVVVEDNDTNEENIVDENAIEVDANQVITVIPDNAELLVESENLHVYLSVDNELLIHADAGGEADTEFSGNWNFDLGGQQYTVVEGTEEIIITIEEPPVGTYQVSAVFASPANDVQTEIGVLNVSVPTVTGGELPTTATPYYNMLLIGAMLVLLGAFTFYRMKRYE